MLWVSFFCSGGGGWVRRRRDCAPLRSHRPTPRTLFQLHRRPDVGHDGAVPVPTSLHHNKTRAPPVPPSLCCRRGRRRRASCRRGCRRPGRHRRRRALRVRRQRADGAPVRGRPVARTAGGGAATVSRRWCGRGGGGGGAANGGGTLGQVWWWGADHTLVAGGRHVVPGQRRAGDVWAGQHVARLGIPRGAAVRCGQLHGRRRPVLDCHRHGVAPRVGAVQHAVLGLTVRVTIPGGRVCPGRVVRSAHVGDDGGGRVCVVDGDRLFWIFEGPQPGRTRSAAAGVLVCAASDGGGGQV